MWPFLLVGTLAGTALLITLPLGVIVWWLTLILARSAARLEVGHLHAFTDQLGYSPRSELTFRSADDPADDVSFPVG